ncbi:hypothetical protein ILUMI_26636 [Ignelater luminosus]|uniref:DDE-1 domain-containing protein n=1 Tax=Ignelater luminosus TaxID=2038154 RepID=A0A8K0C472_IGNLU|nr:hypothetical protein ILUMI_26636 [Ignelater luminosus]
MKASRFLLLRLRSFRHHLEMHLLLVSLESLQEYDPFYPSIVNAKVEFPVLLFVDGHKTHLDIKLSDLCSNLQIILVALYPSATRILQPADVSAFKPLKTGWKKGLAEWRRENPEKDVTKETFAPILQSVLEKSINPKIIVNEFRACGLNPWNPYAINYSKCLGKNPSHKIKQENTVKNGALTYEKFFQIVGPNKINEFKKIDNIKENENEDFIKLYQIWKNFDEGGKQKHKNEDRESISEEILNIEAMELFIDDNKSLNLSNICDNNIILDQTTKIVDINDQIPSYAGNEVTLEKSKQNEVVLPKVVFEEEAITANRGLKNRQQTKTKETETETVKEKLTNLVTVPEKSLLYDEERQNSKQFNEKVKILSDIQILPSSRTHVRNLLTLLDSETDKHCQSTLEEQGIENTKIVKKECTIFELDAGFEKSRGW